MLSGLPTGFTARAAAGHGLLPHPGRRRPRDCWAGPRRCATVTRSLLDRGRLRAGARAGRPTPAPRTSPSRRSCAGRSSSARRETSDPRRGAADDRGRARRASSSTSASSARDPHRSRPAHARGGRRACPPTTPVSAAMTAPAYTVAADRLGSEVCWTCSTAGSATCPSSRRPAGSSASSRTPTWSAAEARTPFHLRAAIARAPTSTSSPHAARELRPTIVALHRARDRRRCTSPPSTRWSSTRSSGG